MFVQPVGQHATYFFQDTGCRMESNDGINTSGNWESAFAAPEALGLGSTINFVPKSAAGEHNSPMGHLHGFDSASSATMQAALNNMGSLTLGEHPFIQVSNPYGALLFNNSTSVFAFSIAFKYISIVFFLIYLRFVPNAMARTLPSMFAGCTRETGLIGLGWAPIATAISV